MPDFPLIKLKKMATIVVFALSLLVASALLVLKAVELRRGRKNMVLEFMGRLDAKSEILVSSLKFRGLQLIQSLRYIALVQTKTICKNLLDKVEEKIMNEYRARQSAIMMGRKNISGNGSASFYLKKITENKDSGEKGKIEENLKMPE